MRQVFWIVPASGAGFQLTLGGILLINAVLILLFAWFGLSARRTRYEVSEEGLSIHSALYGRMIPAGSLDVERARQVDLSQEADLRLSLRTNGVGMPGYGAGWFRLKNGEKALAFVTDRQRVVYVPTREGYSILLSTTEPEALLDAIKRLR